MSRPHRITEAGRHLATATTYRAAQVAVARRIAGDVEGRVLTITGPDGIVHATVSPSLGITYTAAA